MPRLSEVSALYVGSSAVSKVMLGSQQIWTPSALTLPDDVSGSSHDVNLSSTTFGWSHTVESGLENSLLLVAIANSGSGLNSHFPTAVTYGGVALTAVPGAVASNNSSTPRSVRLFYLKAPPAGTANIVVTMNSGTGANCSCIARNLQYVDQSTPFGTAVAAEANSGTTGSVTVSGATATDLILSAAVARSVSTTNYPIADAGFIDNHAHATSTFLTVAGKAGGGSQTATYTWASTNHWAMVTVPIRGTTSSGGGATPSDFAMTIAAAEGGGTFTRKYLQDFNTNAAEGAGEAAYGSVLDMYPTSFKMTNQSGTGADYYGDWTNVSFHDSCLDMRLYIDGQGRAVGSAPEIILPGPTKYQTFGRYAFRFRVSDPEAEWKTAWLLWNLLIDQGTMTWPAGGEYDMLEGPIDGNMGVFHHWYNATAGNQQDAWPTSGTYPFGTGWHTVVAEWTPNYVRSLFDGVEIGRRNSSTSGGGTSRIVDDPMRCALQTEVELGGGNPTEEAHILIDWIVVHGWAA